MKQLIIAFVVLSFSKAVSADKFKDSFVEAAFSGNIMLVKTHINDLRGKGKERHNEALRAAVVVDDNANSQAPSRFKGKAIDVAKMLLAAGANPNDQSFGRPTIFSTATNPEIKTLLQTSGGKNSISDYLADAVKQQNLAEFEKILAQASVDELKLGNGIHIPSAIFESYKIKSSGDLVSYDQSSDPLLKMYVSLVNSKKATDLFVVYQAETPSDFGRREKTHPLIELFVSEERWDLIEILVDQNVAVLDPTDKELAAMWFNYRTNLLLSLNQKTAEVANNEKFKKMNSFFDAEKIKKFDVFARRLPPIEQDRLDNFFLEVDLPEVEKLKFFENMNWKISSEIAAKYIVKIEKVLTEQEFKMLERSTNKNEKKISAELIIPVFESGNIKTAQHLLRLGASADSAVDGVSGLCIAIKKNNFQLAQLLLSYKATRNGLCDKTVPFEKMDMTPQLRRLLFGQNN